MSSHRHRVKSTVIVFLGIMGVMGARRSATAQVPAEERAALIDLYNSTDGLLRVDNSGWREAIENTECTWFGVMCDAVPQVERLILPANGLHGVLP